MFIRGATCLLKLLISRQMGDQVVLIHFETDFFEIAARGKMQQYIEGLIGQAK